MYDTERNKDPRFTQAVLDSNIGVVNEYVTSSKRLPVIHLEHFNPFYEFLDYVANTGNYSLITKINRELLRSNDLNKVSYFARRLVKKSSDYGMELLKNIIRRYAEQWFNPIDHRRYGDTSYYKIALSMTINDVKSYINLQDIVSYIIDLKNDNITSYVIVQLDAVLYAIFEVINDQILESTDNSTLEEMVLLSIQMSVSDMLTEVLLKHLDPESKYNSEEYRNRIDRYTLPNDYVSLFEESV